MATITRFACAVTGADLFADAGLVAAARADFEHQLDGASYRSGIPKFQTPLLDQKERRAPAFRPGFRATSGEAGSLCIAELPANGVSPIF